MSKKSAWQWACFCYKLERNHVGNRGANIDMLCFTVPLVCEVLKGGQQLMDFFLGYNNYIINACWNELQSVPSRM